jgi:hypothetical protein
MQPARREPARRLRGAETVNQPKEDSLEAGQGMVITVTILNSSSAQLVLTQGALTAGVWDGQPPVPGTTLDAGATSFVNDSETSFGGAGGYILLTPAGGGSVSLSWTWSPGQPLVAYGSLSGTSAILLSYSVTGVSTFHPTVTYVITDPGGLEDSAGDRR